MRYCPPNPWCLAVLAFSLFFPTGGCVRSQVAPPLNRPHEAAFNRTHDVAYGQRSGEALTLDVFTPQQNANGAAVLWIVSGGWYSSRKVIDIEISRQIIEALVQRGYTVFAVVPSSQPRFTISAMRQDLQHAVRYVRYHAADYHIDSNRIGITGASSGGHLALLQAMSGNAGDPEAKDPVDRTSSRVQAVACFFPPTDFLNYGTPGQNALGRGILKDYAAAFAFEKRRMGRDEASQLVPVSEKEKMAIGRDISPINHVTPTAPPTLIIHGDQDPLVPYQQAETMIDRLQKAHIPAQLIRKPGAGHGWPELAQDMPKLADWFDKYLLKQ